MKAALEVSEAALLMNEHEMAEISNEQKKLNIKCMIDVLKYNLKSVEEQK